MTEREKVNRRLQEIIDGHTEPWGVKVSVVEVKDVDLPDAMKRSMARQAEAERERTKVINAEGEFQAADKLRQAAQIMTPYPMAMQMRLTSRLSRTWPRMRIPPLSSHYRWNCWGRSSSTGGMVRTPGLMGEPEAPHPRWLRIRANPRG